MCWGYRWGTVSALGLANGSMNAMLSWIVLIAILILLIIFGTWAWSATFGWFDGLGTPDADIDVPRANRSAVENNRFEDIAFDVVARGYRQDQVDDVIESLANRLAEAEARLARNAAPASPLDPKSQPLTGQSENLNLNG